MRLPEDSTITEEARIIRPSHIPNACLHPWPIKSLRSYSFHLPSQCFPSSPSLLASWLPSILSRSWQPHKTSWRPPAFSPVLLSVSLARGTPEFRSEKKRITLLQWGRETLHLTCDQALLFLLVREGLERSLPSFPTNSSPVPRGPGGKEGPDRRLRSTAQLNLTRLI